MQLKSDSISNRVTSVLLVLSVSINVALARQNRSLTAKFDALLASAVFGAGKEAPPFEALKLDGTKTSVRLDGPKPVLLYMLSSVCPACQKNEDRVAELVEQIRNRVDVYFVALDSAGFDPTKIRLPAGVQLLLKPTPQTVKDYRLGATPYTVYVRNGTIEGGWVETFVSANARQMSGMLGAQLREH